LCLLSWAGHYLYVMLQNPWAGRYESKMGRSFVRSSESQGHEWTDLQ